MGAASQLRIDAVKALARQSEAHAVPLERKQEQKLWEAFRQPIDEAFARKSSEREKATTALNAHDQRVLDASQAVDAASASGDAQQIRAAMAELEAALRGQAAAVAAAPAPKAIPQVVAPDAAAAAAPEQPGGMPLQKQRQPMRPLKQLQPKPPHPSSRSRHRRRSWPCAATIARA
jgi:hypothetical protein